MLFGFKSSKQVKLLVPNDECLKALSSKKLGMEVHEFCHGRCFEEQLSKGWLQLEDDGENKLKMVYGCCFRQGNVKFF